jgi:hypothetical protein
MARKIRVEFEGATYHVMCRGDRRENIFEDDLDRARFLQTLDHDFAMDLIVNHLGIAVWSAKTLLTVLRLEPHDVARAKSASSD